MLTVSTEPLKLSGHLGRISTAMADRAKKFVTGSRRPQRVEKEVRIWNFPSGELLDSIESSFNAVFSLACSPDNRYLAIGGGGIIIGDQWQYTKGIEIWKLDELQRVAYIGEELYFVKSLAFSPDGSLLLSTNYAPPGSRPRPRTACVRLWRSSDFKQVAAFAESEDSVQSACFSPDGERVVFAYDRDQGTKVSIPAAVVRSSTPSELANRVARMRDMVDDVAVPTSPLVRVWNIKTKQEERSFAIFGGIVTRLDVSPDGRLLVSSGTNLTLWNFVNGRKLEDLDDRSSRFSFSHCAAFSPDGKMLAAGTGGQPEFGSPWENCGVKLWDLSSRTLITHLPHQKPVYSLAFSGDGKTLIAGGDSELILWRLDD